MRQSELIRAVLTEGDEAALMRLSAEGIDPGVALDLAVLVPAVAGGFDATVGAVLDGATVLLGRLLRASVCRLAEQQGAVAVATTADVGAHNLRTAYGLARSGAVAAARLEPPGLVDWADAFYFGALAGDAAAREAFVEEVLGAVPNRLMATLEALHASGWRTESAAATLGVHPNTVRYRVQRAEQEMGLSLVEARDREYLSVVFVMRALLGKGPAALWRECQSAFAAFAGPCLTTWLRRHAGRTF